MFAFAIGGLGSVLYEASLRMEHRRIDERELHGRKRWFHIFSLVIAPAVFVSLFFLSGLNPITV
jgi:hypothetical protein